MNAQLSLLTCKLRVIEALERTKLEGSERENDESEGGGGREKEKGRFIELWFGPFQVLRHCRKRG